MQLIYSTLYRHCAQIHVNTHKVTIEINSPVNEKMIDLYYNDANTQLLKNNR